MRYRRRRWGRVRLLEQLAHQALTTAESYELLAELHPDRAAQFLAAAELARDVWETLRDRGHVAGRAWHA